MGLFDWFKSETPEQKLAREAKEGASSAYQSISGGPTKSSFWGGKSKRRTRRSKKTNKNKKHKKTMGRRRH